VCCFSNGATSSSILPSQHPTLWLPTQVAKFPSDGTDRVILDALRRALRDLENIRLFASPYEAKHIAELKGDLRARISSLEHPPTAKAAD